MLIESGGDRLVFELVETAAAETPAAGDLCLHVRLTSEGFSGENPDVWISAEAARRFADDLAALERDRRGQAELRSMSPEELLLRVAVIDRAGHIGITGHLGRYQFPRGTAAVLQQLTFDLDFDAGLLRSLSEDWAAGLLPAD
jgi:hypothetical protein